MARKRFMRGGRSVRETMWVGVQESATSMSSANSAILIASMNAALLALRPFTIIRVRGVWLIRSDQTSVSEDQQVALTYAVVSDQASAIGITAVPTGFTDIGSDLFFVHQMQLSQFLVTTDIGRFYTPDYRTYDSKAMRKVNDDQDMVVCIENSSLSAGTITTHAARMLIKLH